MSRIKYLALEYHAPFLFAPPCMSEVTVIMLLLIVTSHRLTSTAGHTLTQSHPLTPCPPGSSSTESQSPRLTLLTLPCGVVGSPSSADSSVNHDPIAFPTLLACYFTLLYSTVLSCPVPLEGYVVRYSKGTCTFQPA